MVKVLIEILFTCLASRPFDSKDLQEVVAELKARNAKYGITGVLVYNDREFFQILEGEKKVLIDLMDTVREDMRHGNIHIVWQGEIKRRAYTNWGLAQEMRTKMKHQTTYALPTSVNSVSKDLLRVLINSNTHKFIEI